MNDLICNLGYPILTHPHHTSESLVWGPGIQHTAVQHGRCVRWVLDKTNVVKQFQNMLVSPVPVGVIYTYIYITHLLLGVNQVPPPFHTCYTSNFRCVHFTGAWPCCQTHGKSLGRWPGRIRAAVPRERRSCGEPWTSCLRWDATWRYMEIMEYKVESIECVRRYEKMQCTFVIMCRWYLKIYVYMFIYIYMYIMSRDLEHIPFSYSWRPKACFCLDISGWKL